MASIYDKAEIYDLLEDKTRWQAYRRHWQTVLDGAHIETLLDVSIGSGGVTLPLAELGVQLSGSDLSGAMLARCREKAAAKGIGIDLRQSDFRAAGACFDTQFDCVASTGNSLPYVCHEDVCKALTQMDSLVRPGGYLYFDMRNWDKILQNKYRFYLYDPFFRDDIRINFMQVWDYEPDGSMTFHLLYTFEKNGHIFHKEKFEEHYIPIPQKILLAQLEKLGYDTPRILPFPAGRDASKADGETGAAGGEDGKADRETGAAGGEAGKADGETGATGRETGAADRAADVAAEADWYCVLAKKRL